MLIFKMDNVNDNTNKEIVLDITEDKLNDLEYIKRELARVSAYVENRAQHNIFYRQQIANR